MSGKVWVTDIKDMVLNFTEIDESALGEWRVRRNRGGEPQYLVVRQRKAISKEIEKEQPVRYEKHMF